MGFGGNSQVRGGAEFRALREYMGLSVEDFARVTCASVSKVVAWEGLSGHIPGKVWRLVDEAVDVFDNLVDDLADVEVADWRPGGETVRFPCRIFARRRNARRIATLVASSLSRAVISVSTA